MSRLTNKLLMTTGAAATLFFFGAFTVFAQAGGSATPATTTKAPKVKAPAAPPPTDAEIGDASNQGLSLGEPEHEGLPQSGCPNVWSHKKREVHDRSRCESSRLQGRAGAEDEESCGSSDAEAMRLGKRATQTKSFLGQSSPKGYSLAKHWRTPPLTKENGQFTSTWQCV